MKRDKTIICIFYIAILILFIAAFCVTFAGCGDPHYKKTNNETLSIQAATRHNLVANEWVVTQKSISVGDHGYIVFLARWVKMPHAIPEPFAVEHDPDCEACKRKGE